MGKRDQCSKLLGQECVILGRRKLMTGDSGNLIIDGWAYLAGDSSRRSLVKTKC